MYKNIFRIISYFNWTLLAFLLAFCYMRIILGSKPESSTWFMKILGWIYEYALINIGMIIGSIIAVTFILLDFFYLNKRLKNIAYSTIIRLLILITISIVVGISHFILEKVIDVI